MTRTRHRRSFASPSFGGDDPGDGLVLSSDGDLIPAYVPGHEFPPKSTEGPGVPGALFRVTCGLQMSVGADICHLQVTFARFSRHQVFDQPRENFTVTAIST